MCGDYTLELLPQTANYDSEPAGKGGTASFRSTSYFTAGLCVLEREMQAGRRGGGGNPDSAPTVGQWSRTQPHSQSWEPALTCPHPHPSQQGLASSNEVNLTIGKKGKYSELDCMPNRTGDHQRVTGMVRARFVARGSRSPFFSAAP